MTLKITNKAKNSLRLGDLKPMDVFNFVDGHRHAHRTDTCLCLGLNAEEFTNARNGGYWLKARRDHPTFVNMKTGKTVHTSGQASEFHVVVLDAELVLS